MKYVELLEKLAKLMFPFDKYNYARWHSVHIKDLRDLRESLKCPEVPAEFTQGHFVTQKSAHKFPAMADDQVHEQLNAMAKVDGGDFGLTESDNALRGWMLGGPEIARIITVL